MPETLTPRGLDAARLRHLKATIEADIASGRYHGAGIIVARDGQIGLHEALGRVRSTSQNPVRKDSVFSLLSVTKAITNVLVLRAIERGQLNLFTKVSSLIPEFSGLPRSEITVEHLLTHRSGLPSVYTPRAGMNLDRLDEIVGAICSSLHAVDEPGTRVNYSPMAGHALLGELLRRTDPQKRSYRKIVQDDLFGPLGMKDSSIGVRADLKARHIPPELPPEFPATHPGSSNLGTHGAFEEEHSEMPWVGGFATVGDMYRFAEMLRRGGELDGARLLSPRMIDMATQNRTGDLPNMLFSARGLTRGWRPSPAYIGWGFQLRGEAVSRHIFGTLTSPRTFGNQGAGSTLYWVDPALGLTFVCLTVRVVEDGDNIERFQRLSDIAVSAAV
ncbi:MAG TPA: serine hydrolase domain-containing protein [Stellaceae bacterium]|jgi:CubicO group peptidase (beta-lactamase class C family)|nr:serine hydrolase domain-containing protein [Stellaceae bacterium]